LHFQHTTGLVTIDITGDEYKEHLDAWFAPTEGIFIDTTLEIVNGEVTGHHFSGDQGGHFLDGYQKLAPLHDFNEDSTIDADALKGQSGLIQTRMLVLITES